MLTGRRIARERAEFSRFTSPLSGRVLTPDIIVSFRNNFFSYHVADSIFFFLRFRLMRGSIKDLLEE